jgi:hypothetical protein
LSHPRRSSHEGRSFANLHLTAGTRTHIVLPYSNLFKDGCLSEFGRGVSDFSRVFPSSSEELVGVFPIFSELVGVCRYEKK